MMPHDDNSELTPATVAVLSAVRENALPKCLESTVIGNVPASLRFICEPVSPDESWALENDFVPVWTNDHTSCMAFVPSTGNYRYQHIEEFLAGEATFEFSSFEDVAVWVLSQLIGEPDANLTAAAKFLGYGAVNELLACKSGLEFLAKHNLEHLG